MIQATVLVEETEYLKEKLIDIRKWIAVRIC